MAVTRGLVDTLSDDELEAVLAHELTHIRNRDTQLMVIAVVFAGIFAFFGDLIIRGSTWPYGWAPPPNGIPALSYDSSSSGRSEQPAAVVAAPSSPS